MTKISVIIPLYNSARYLPSLFRNIAQQSIAADLEFIFIDDHGGDDSLSLARSLAASSSLKCIFGATAANGGPGAARNVGLKMAGGEYVAFLDSDDNLDPLFCEVLYESAVKYDADIAYCHVMAVKEGRTAVWSNPLIESGEFDREKRLYFLKNYKSYFTSFIYKREMLCSEGITFPATRSAEDSCFLTCALLCVRSIAMVNAPLYFYILRRNSLSMGRMDNRHMQRMESFDALLEFARSKGFYESDKEILDYLYIKKAAVGAARNRPFARRQIREHLSTQIPDWRSNALYRSDRCLRAAVLLLLGK